MEEMEKRYQARLKRIPEVATLNLKRHQIYPPKSKNILNSIVTKQYGLIDHTTPIASMGSCFAREIKDYLEAKSYNYLSTSGEQEAKHGSAMWERVYSTPCISQEINRGLGIFVPLIKQFNDGRAIDPYRKHVGQGRIFDNTDILKENCIRAAKAAHDTLKSAKIFIITLGLSEVWFDQFGNAFAEPLPKELFESDKHSMKLLSPDENIEYLETAINTLNLNYPDLKIILTVSPVPLRASFIDRSAIVSNTISKASLLWAAHQISFKYSSVFYFPSYEIIMNYGEDPFEWDFRHIKSEAVKTVMSAFELMFMTDQAEVSK